MTADEYRAALGELGLSQLAIGRLFGVSGRTAQSWAKDGPTGPAAFAIRLLLSLDPEARARWIGSPKGA